MGPGGLADRNCVYFFRLSARLPSCSRARAYASRKANRLHELVRAAILDIPRSFQDEIDKGSELSTKHKEVGGVFACLVDDSAIGSYNRLSASSDFVNTVNFAKPLRHLVIKFSALVR